MKFDNILVSGCSWCYRPYDYSKPVGVRKTDIIGMTKTEAINLCFGKILSDKVIARQEADYPVVDPSQVNYTDVAPNQIASISASLIPFLEHDDANRALMGSNMMRQSVPLLRPESPIVGTGLERQVASDSRVLINADFNGNVDISGSLTHTGSLDVLGDITASGNIKATIGNFDTVNTRVLHVTQESASVIFSSGSNVLGDEETDRQDLIGQVIVSGTLGVEGSSSFTGSLTVSNEISSSTVNGIGNVTIYSASVDNRLDQLEVSSGSQDSQLNNLENFTASQENINSGYNSFTSSYFTDSASFDNRIDQLESDTGSQDSRLDSLEAFTGSQETLNGFYNSFTASNGNTSLNSFTSSYFIDSASFDLRLDEQEAFSSSLSQDFVSTGSFNTYTASQDTINGFYNAFTASNGNTSLNLYTQSADIRLNNLELETSSIDNRFNILEAETASLQVEIDGLSLFIGLSCGNLIFPNKYNAVPIAHRIQITKKASYFKTPQCSTRSAVDRNLNAKASSINPKETLSFFNQIPDLGITDKYFG